MPEVRHRAQPKPLKLAESVAFETGGAALWLAGFVVFVPQAALMALYRTTVSADVVIGWAIPFVIWLLALFSRSILIRAIWQTLATLLATGIPLLWPQATGPEVAPLHLSAFAIVFAANFTLPVAFAAFTLVIATAIDLLAISILPGQAALWGMEVADGFAAPIYLAIAGTGLLIFVATARASASDEDRRVADLRKSTEQAYRSAKISAHRLAAGRQIHETVLNTLNSIALGSGQRDLIIAACQNDVRQIQGAGRTTAPETDLAALIDRVVAAVPFTGTVSISQGGTAELPPLVAGAVRDALTEVMRNVARHSSATSVAIDTTIGNGLARIAVTDNGVGINSVAHPRFGMAVTVQDSLELVGGKAQISRMPEGGTEVSLQFPLGLQPLPAPTSQAATAVLFRTKLSRSSVAATAWGVLALMPWFFQTDVRLAAFVGSYSFMLICYVVLALAWSTRWRSELAILSHLSGLAVLVLLFFAPATCTTANAALWAANGLGGTSVLSLLAIGNTANRILLAVSSAIALVTISLRVPASCRPGPLSALFAVVAFLTFAAYALVPVIRRLRKRNLVAEQRWWGAIERAVRADAELAQEAVWTLVRPSVVALLAGIGSGKLDPDSPEVRQRARAEESRIRAQLTLATKSGGTLVQLLVELHQAVQDLGKLVETKVIGQPNGNHEISPDVRKVAMEICRQAPSGTVLLTAIGTADYEELLLTCPTRTLWQVRSQLGEDVFTAFTFYEGDLGQPTVLAARIPALASRQ